MQGRSQWCRLYLCSYIVGGGRAGSLTSFRGRANVASTITVEWLAEIRRQKRSWFVSQKGSRMTEINRKVQVMLARRSSLTSYQGRLWLKGNEKNGFENSSKCNCRICNVRQVVQTPYGLNTSKQNSSLLHCYIWPKAAHRGHLDGGRTPRKKRGVEGEGRTRSPIGDKECEIFNHNQEFGECCERWRVVQGRDEMNYSRLSRCTLVSASDPSTCSCVDNGVKEDATACRANLRRRH